MTGREASVRALDRSSAIQIVRQFYEVLQQDKPITSEQEHELLTPTSTLRLELALTQGKAPELPPALKKIQEIDPMKRTADERAALAVFRADRAKRVAAAGPLVMEYFRQHKDWFLPRGPRASIVISTPFSLLKYHPDDSATQDAAGTIVLVWLQDRDKSSATGRTLLFFIDHGRIAPDEILVEGTAGKWIDSPAEANSHPKLAQ